jgi:hypothetical protein
MFQGLLYCTRCSQEADRARKETAAFKQALVEGGLYSCGRCNAPVSIAAIRAGSVIYISGVLSCVNCSKDLRALLLRQGRATSAAPPAPALGGSRPPLGGVGGASRISDRLAAVPPPQAPDLTVSQRLKAASAVQAADLTASQRLKAGASGRVPAASSSQRLKPSVARKCEGCGASVTEEDLAQRRAFAEHGEVYCAACHDSLDQILQTSRADLAQLTRFTCGGCGAVVPADDIVDDRAVRSRGQVYCATCKADFGRSSIERGAGPPEKPTVATTVPEVACARCERVIPPIEIRTGKALEIGGRLHCRRCRPELEDARAALEKRLGKAVTCSHCARVISHKEIKALKVVYRDGNVICGTCSRDPKVVLFGQDSFEGSLPTLCKACGETLGEGDREVCRGCQGKLEAIYQRSIEASAEIESCATVPCDRCRAPVTAEEVSKGKAGVDRKKVLCAACLAATPIKKETKAPQCSRCRGPLPPGRKATDDALCERCLAVSIEDDRDTEAALALSAEVELRCSRCERQVGREDLALKRAVAVEGRLMCAVCRAAAVAPAHAASKENAKTTGAPCGTCSGPITGDPYVFSGRRFCQQCKSEFERLLRGATLKGPVTCASCKKPAAGEGALKIEGRAFCAGCRRAADLLLMCTVIDRRKKRVVKVPSLGVFAGAVGSALVVVSVVLVVMSRGGKDAGPAIVQHGDGAAVGLTALQRGAALSAMQPRSYADAVANLAELSRLAAQDPSPSDAETWKSFVAKATDSRDRTIPPLVNGALEIAGKAFKRQNVPEEALAALKDFPAEVLEMPQGKPVSVARESYTLLATCRRNALTVLGSTEPDRYEAMGRILASPEAKRCGFLTSELGKRLDIEFRKARNEFEASHGSRPRPAPDTQSLPKALILEKQLDIVPAEAAYAKALDSDRDSVDALLGLLRCQLEREEYLAASETAERASRLAKGRPATAVLEAWLAYLALEGNQPDSATHAAALLKAINRADLGRLGRRLEAILALGPPAAQTRHWRLYAPDMSREQVHELEPQLESAFDNAVTVYDLPPVLSRLDVFLFGNGASLAAFRRKLELAPVLAAEAWALPGCGAVALTDPRTVMLAVSVELGKRAPAVPPWVVFGLGHGTTWTEIVPLVKGKPAEPQTPAKPEISIADLERMTLSSLSTDTKAAEAAMAYTSVVRGPLGAKRLGNYVARRATSKNAASELESDLKLNYFRADHQP